MMPPVIITGMGAVTAVGLTAPQTCAAIRARIAGFRQLGLIAPPHAPVVSAAIPAHLHLKATPQAWLANMAVRAIRECLDGHEIDYGNTALLLAFPDAYREHDGTRNARELFTAIQNRLRASFHPASAAFEEGRAGAFTAVSVARRLLQQETVEQCIVGGVDSLVNNSDALRLAAAGRLHEPGNPQGTIPGEGAACLLLTARTSRRAGIAQIFGCGLDHEPDTAVGERYAVGQGLRAALTAAVRDAQCQENEIEFRVSDMNGERYYAWDSTLGSSRFYRTRREQFTVWYPASCAGDTGAAAGALDMVVAANAIARGFAPGPLGMCEGGSDEGTRGACVVGCAPGSPLPPFRPGEDA
jgi:3-oxoacyl-[acyl-carrier-protein] synthase-1